MSTPKLTQSRRFQIAAIGLIVLFCCTIMAVVDGVLHPPYFAKSMIKVLLFALCPLLYSLCQKDMSLKTLFTAKRKTIFTALALGGAVYILIFGAYLLLRGVIDFSAVTGALTENAGVTKANFPVVALYISVVNSFLEEFFFRGFAFLTLKKITSPKIAHAFSALSFALYHVAMMIGWFSLPVFLLAMLGLAAGGVLFNLLCARGDSIYPSWTVHMFANFAINTIGFLLFDAA